MIANGVAAVGRVGFFTLRSVSLMLRPPFYPGEVVRLTVELCAQCLVPVLVVMFPFGMVVSIQGLDILKEFGAQRLLGSVLVVSIFRELAPGLAGIMIAAQGGSSMAAELGSMRTDEEIDAQEVAAVNTIQYLVAPRLLALTFVGPIVSSMAGLMGVAGGYVTAVWMKGVNHGVFISNLFTFVNLMDVWSGVIKTAIFGFIIASISCYKGYTVVGGAAEVGRAANDAVVYSIVALLGANYLLSTAMFGAGV